MAFVTHYLIDGDRAACRPDSYPDGLVVSYNPFVVDCPACLDILAEQRPAGYTPGMITITIPEGVRSKLDELDQRPGITGQFSGLSGFSAGVVNGLFNAILEPMELDRRAQEEKARLDHLRENIGEFVDHLATVFEIEPDEITNPKPGKATGTLLLHLPPKGTPPSPYQFGTRPARTDRQKRGRD